MKRYALFLLLATLCATQNTNAESATEKLEKYKTHLEHGTYDQQNWSKFEVKPKSRYYTFAKVFDHFEQTGGKIIVELGTTHSFVHGGLPGCDSDDIGFWTPDKLERWDWGAGCFTIAASECLAHCNPKLYTIDISASALKRCRIMTSTYQQFITYQRTDSEAFLRSCNFKNGIDLLYLDTGYMNPIEPTAQLQLREAQIVVERNLMSPNGLILIDDVRNQNVENDNSGLGKSRYAIPYLLENGFEIIEDEYQVILRKKT